MAWRVAYAVTTWHANLQAVYPAAKPPATPTVAWGTIGDTSHTSTSDHSPHDFPGWGSDIVTAGDAPHAPSLGLDMHKVTEAMRVSRDQRIKYVIWDRRIFSSYASAGYAPFVWRPYSNASSDPHTDHAHLSVVGDPRGDLTTPWEVGVTLTPDESQRLKNIEDWLFDFFRGMVTPDAGTPHVTKYVPNEALKTLVDRPSTDLTEAQVEAIAAKVAEKLIPLIPSEDEINTAVDAAVEARMNGATIRTAGH